MKKNISDKRRFIIDRLGYFRARANLSARELSLRMGKSIAYIAKFDNGDFNMPSEELLLAMEICETTPEEFFSTDLQNYARNKNLIDSFNSLTEENKQTILDLIKKLK